MPPSLWTAQQIDAAGAQSTRPDGCASAALAIAILVLLQIYLGALVAGLRRRSGLQYLAADRRRFRAGQRRRLWFIAPAWRNLFENTLTVQFDHRMLAYAIWAARRDCTPSMRWQARQRRGEARSSSPARSRCRRRSASSRCCNQAPIALCARASDACDCRVHHRDRSCRTAVRIAAEYRSVGACA